MNEEKIKRVLKGISHTGYITELERCEARICIEQLQQENTQSKENWDKLEEYCKNYASWIKDDVDMFKVWKTFHLVLDKMEELKGSESK